MAEEREGGFKITDKRSFTPEGELRETEKAEESAKPSEPSVNGAPDSKRGAEIPPDDKFQMTFETLVMSLSSTAMVQLGVLVDPATNQPEPNLPAAKHTIDILEILQVKTKGNLTASESKLLDNILYELRMVFLELTQAIQRP